MTKISETGHAKNVANFQTLITYCNGYGPSYNPANPAIATESLTALHERARNSLDAVTLAKANYDHATNEREIAFEPILKLCTRIVNALDACGASEQKVKDSRSILNRMQGRRAGKKEEAPSPEKLSLQTPLKQKISVSHTGFDNKIASLGDLLQLLLTEPNYHPNEQELSTAMLNNNLATLNSVMDRVRENTVVLSNARIKRNEILYLSDNCLCELAQDVKKYVKSIFGTSGPQFKQVSAIRFTNSSSLV